jgi:hypothetical protein
MIEIASPATPQPSSLLAPRRRRSPNDAKALRERPWNYEMSLGSTWDRTIAGKVTSASEARERIM